MDWMEKNARHKFFYRVKRVNRREVVSENAIVEWSNGTRGGIRR